ncbi:MAG: UDP-N-acetylmuramoyl-L-alanine--D-glutamate ligase, partial [Symploca sp. SIO2E6]|nr:UDP-N-acetylmuramoyl-L-alanine--D-glutamate ligase [Symploca sp. SIO2E6]
MPNAQVIGLGRSGIAAARLLKQNGWQVTVSDSASPESFAARYNSETSPQQVLTEAGITVKLGHSLTLDTPDLPQLIVVSPGVPWNIPVLKAARDQGIDTIGELELAWRYLNSCPWVGITGTNGKTTTTALISAIFQTAGFHAPACGNIGYAACELALEEMGRWGDGEMGRWGDKEDKGDKETVPKQQTTNNKQQSTIDWVIAEISSYQIESSQKLAPHIGILTTLTPDHLSRHKTIENYYEIKASLLHRSKMQVINGDDPYLRRLGKSHWPDAYWTSIQGRESGDLQPWVYIENGWAIAQSEPILPVASLKMLGSHNHQNLL